MTREELQEIELKQYEFLRSQVARLRAMPDADPYVGGIMHSWAGISWLAIYQETDGAKEFLDAAAYFLDRETAACVPSARDAAELYQCSGVQMRAFLVRSLMEPDDMPWSLFDGGMKMYVRGMQLAPIDIEAEHLTPRIVYSAGLAAFGALHGHPVPAPLLDLARHGPVDAPFRNLRHALISVADDPGPERCTTVHEVYHRAISLADYRSPHVDGFSLEQLLPASAVGEGGDLLRGAFNIFE